VTAEWVAWSVSGGYFAGWGYVLALANDHGSDGWGDTVLNLALATLWPLLALARGALGVHDWMRSPYRRWNR